MQDRRDDIPPSREPSGLILSEVFRQSPSALVITDPNLPDNPVVHVNPAFVRMTGYGEDEVIGRNCRFLQGRDTDPATAAAIRDVLDRREEAVFEILNYRKDGTSFWNSLHVGPILGDDGTVRYFFGAQRNVTAHVEATRQQAEIAERLTVALEAARAVGIFDWDVASDRLAVDEGFARAFGLDPGRAAQGLPIAAFYENVDDGSREGLQAAVDEAVRTGDLFEHEYGVEGSDRHRWLMGRGRCLHDADGQPTRFTGVVVDITRRKEAEDTLRTELAKAEITRREVDHRIQNLFALIPAIVNLSARRARNSDEFARSVQDRIAALARAHSLTIDAYSRANGVDLERLLRAVFEPFTDHAEPFTLDGPAIRLSSSEAGALALIFYELATNSAKHGALSRQAGRVVIRWDADPQGAATGRRTSDDALSLIWTESGGPQIERVPERAGGGTALVDRLMLGFGGTVDRTWNRDGLSIVFGVPLERGARLAAGSEQSA